MKHSVWLDGGRVNREFGLRTATLAAAAAFLAMGIACAPSAARHENTQATRPVDDPTRATVINHLVPARDSIGRAPARFSWTPVPGADSYSVGIWNEVDVLVWRQNHITETSVTRPEDVPLEPGTYFWSISALREDNQIAESGLAAFVVRTIP